MADELGERIGSIAEIVILVAEIDLLADDADQQATLPPALAASCDAFEAFYLAKHGGRRLAWQTAMGHADVRATFSGGRRHELNVSTHQMVVLLLFNDADVLPYADVAARTGIAGPELKRALQSMACVKVRQEWMVWGRGVGWVGVMDGWGEVDGWGREDGGWCVGWGG